MSDKFTSKKTEKKSGFDKVVAENAWRERSHQKLEQRLAMIMDFSYGFEILKRKKILMAFSIR